MTVVTSRIVEAGGRPVPGVYVYAWLRAMSTALADGSRVDERADAYTDRDGRWRLELPPASSMVDTAALWAVREVGYDAYLLRVPDSGPTEATTITTVPGEPPSGTGGLPFTLDRLADVDAPPEAVGLLERQASGVVRPVTRVQVLSDHVEDLTPHPAYDDLPSLTVLFENRLV